MSLKRVTIKLDEDVVRDCEEQARKAGKSLSDWILDELTTSLERQTAFETAKSKALMWLERGLPLGGKPLTREEAHER